jgi:hypothetical protein
MANGQQLDRNMLGIKGSEGHDSGALTSEQQTELNQFKVNLSLNYSDFHDSLKCSEVVSLSLYIDLSDIYQKYT